MIETSVQSLSGAEMVAICASRTYRALREQDRPSCACLCRILHAAHIMPALPAFVDFQRALSIDPAQTITYEMRGAHTLSVGELRLLRALAYWQYRPEEEPQHALLCIATPTIRRTAAASGRAFALQMACEGLWIPERRLTAAVPASGGRATLEGDTHVLALH